MTATRSTPSAGVAGHAGLFSTADDLGVLLHVMLNGGEHAGVRLLSPETVAAFLEPTGDRQALGWQLPGYGPVAVRSGTLASPERSCSGCRPRGWRLYF